MVNRDIKPDQLGIPGIDAGEPVRKSYLPFSKPCLDNEEKAEVIAALDSGWLSTGPRTRRFEDEIKRMIGAKNALAISSCTAGLHLALVSADIGPGDEVITSPFTFISTANVILQTGAKPVFSDIRFDTYNIAVEQLEARITPRTRAVIPVHYGGQPCDMEEIMDLARKNNLLIIEDAATAIGAKYKDRYIGSWDDRVTVFSFYANKVMTTGEGGMLLTGIDEIAEKARILSLHGMTRDAWKRYSETGSWYFEVNAPGFKYNMTDIQAALGLSQLQRLEWFIERRKNICKLYDEAFSEIDEIITPWVSPQVRHSRYIYPILVENNRLRIDRNQFIEALKAENIGTSVHYIPVHFHPFYQRTFGLGRGDYPVTESVFDRLISLPLFPQMTDDDVQDVINAVDRIVNYYRR